jgi:type I restriction enzyme, S subunit
VSAWERVALSEVATSVDYGVTASATEQPLGPKFLRITDIQDGCVDWDRVPWCECGNGAAAGGRLKQGDIVFARTGATTGKSFLIRDCPSDAVFASYLIRVRLGERANSQYVSHYFHTPDYWAQITASARGVAQPGVNASTLKALRIPLPPLPEQRRIAEVLDRAEALRAKRRAALAQLDTLTQSIFFDLFGDPATNPKGWPVHLLQEVVKQGTIVTYGIVQAGEEYPAGVPYIRTGDIVDGEILQHGLRHTDPAIAARFLRSRVEAGEIVISIRATVGTTAVVPPELDGANLTQGTARIAPGSLVDRTYLLYYLRTSGAQHWISLQIKGATFREITLSRLRELPVQVPPMSLQCDFARRIAAVETLRTAHRASIAELDALFAVLQHRAFRGEM